MKHVFIINPIAGKKDGTARVMDSAKKLAAHHALDVDCILTKHAGHARDTARALAASGKPVRIYACGGDGTVNEIANGIAGFCNAAMSCIPVGTGNDFLKNFGDTAPLFANPENLWDGVPFPLDAIDCNGQLAMTVACSGFDATVADEVHKYEGVPLLGGKQSSYILSLGVNFFLRSLGHHWRITLDGVPMTGDFTLASVCNGRYYGGGFMPVAEAKMNDGVLNTIVVRKVSRLAFLRFVGAYSKGKYFTLPHIATCYTAGEIIIESLDDRNIVTCLDGESIYGNRVVVKLSDKKVRFFGPKGCDPNATCVPLPNNL